MSIYNVPQDTKSGTLSSCHWWSPELKAGSAHRSLWTNVIGIPHDKTDQLDVCSKKISSKFDSKCSWIYRSWISSLCWWREHCRMKPWKKLVAGGTRLQHNMSWEFQVNQNLHKDSLCCEFKKGPMYGLIDVIPNLSKSLCRGWFWIWKEARAWSWIWYESLWRTFRIQAILISNTMD